MLIVLFSPNPPPSFVTALFILIIKYIEPLVSLCVSISFCNLPPVVFVHSMPYTALQYTFWCT